MAPYDEAGHPFQPGSVLQLLQLKQQGDFVPAGEERETGRPGLEGGLNQ